MKFTLNQGDKSGVSPLFRLHRSAIRKLIVNALLIRRRAAMTEKFITGEWAAEFPSFEKQRALDRKSAWKS